MRLSIRQTSSHRLQPSSTRAKPLVANEEEIIPQKIKRVRKNSESLDGPTQVSYSHSHIAQQITHTVTISSSSPQLSDRSRLIISGNKFVSHPLYFSKFQLCVLVITMIP